MPEVGDQAPDFELASHQDRHKKVRLSDFKNKKNVVIAFHPLAFTPVCSNENTAYEKEMERFKEYDAEVLSISVDPQPAKAAWAKEMGGVSYDLLSDFEPKGKVAKDYGVYEQDKGFSGRATFVVDKAGVIRYKKVHELSTQPSNQDIFQALAEVTAN